MSAVTELKSAAAAGHHVEDHADSGAGKTPLGFWIYLMSDCILFASIFATFVVQRNSLAGGPSGRELFDLSFVAVETGLLLVSSLTYGLAMIAAAQGNLRTVFVWLALTFVCGLAFIGMEVHEFANLVAEGAGPNRSGFLSGFFTLVGTHGLHVTSGLVWMGVMFAQLASRGLTAANHTRLLCLSLFWHFLDIVWIGVFSIVYLMGAA
jgi:cytochrome o ubiquinol oxidase subunit III